MGHDKVNSPFFFEAPLRSELCDRENELAQLVDLACGGRFVRLTAPRRYGKTSLLQAAFSKLERDFNATCVLCDLDGVVSRSDLAGRIYMAYSTQLTKEPLRVVKDYLAASGISLNLGVVGFRAELATRHDPTDAIERMLSAPQRVAEKTGRPVLVAFDEFQIVLELAKLDGVLRSQIQYQAGSVSYVFCGSEASMIEQLFSDRARPLYGQAIPLTLGPLPSSALINYIGERFEKTERDPGVALDHIVEISQGHPQRAMMLAHQLWIHTPVNGTADESTLATAIAALERDTNPEMVASWSRFSLGEQRSLRAIAARYNDSVSEESLKLLDLPRQTFDAAKRRLRGGGVLRQAYDSGVDVFVDPFLRRWILKNSAVIS